MAGLGTPELLIILVIVLLLFGVGRLSKIAGELGNSIRSFREGLQGSDKDDSQKPQEKPENDANKPQG